MILPGGECFEQVNDLKVPLAIRAEVFIEEQGVSHADEIDGLDDLCLHWLLRDLTGPVGTLRALPKTQSLAKIQRVAILRRGRGRGLGAALMRYAMADLKLQGFNAVTLGAQTTVIGFYERLGFAPHGPVYDDAGLPHRDMSRDL